jgi:hypothetical protein
MFRQQAQGDGDRRENGFIVDQRIVQVQADMRHIRKPLMPAPRYAVQSA